MGAVASVAKKAINGISDGVHAVTHEMGKAVGEVEHVIVKGADGAMHVVSHVPGLGQVIHYAKEGVGKLAEIAQPIAKGVGQIAGTVADVAELAGPAGAEIAKVASTVHDEANVVSHVSALAKSLSAGGQMWYPGHVKVTKVYNYDTEKRDIQEMIHDMGLEDSDFAVTFVGKDGQLLHTVVVRRLPKASDWMRRVTVPRIGMPRERRPREVMNEY